MPATMALVVAPVAGGHDGVHMGLYDPLAIVALDRVYRPSDRRALLHQLAVQKSFTEPAPVVRSDVERDFHHDMPGRHSGGIARRDRYGICLRPDPVRIVRRPERCAGRQKQARAFEFEPPLGEAGRHGTEAIAGLKDNYDYNAKRVLKAHNIVDRAGVLAFDRHSVQDRDRRAIKLLQEAFGAEDDDGGAAAARVQRKRPTEAERLATTTMTPTSSSRRAVASRAVARVGAEKLPARAMAQARSTARSSISEDVSPGWRDIRTRPAQSGCAGKNSACLPLRQRDGT